MVAICSRHCLAIAAIVGCFASPAWTWAQTVNKPDPEIRFWYGDRQHVGKLGDSQPLYNVLGSVTSPERFVNRSYSLNGTGRTPFSLGTDLHRLARSGDFNLEIPRDKLRTGENTIGVFGNTPEGTPIKTELVLVRSPQRTWPLPYAVDFSTVDEVTSHVEVIDGQWTLDPDGLRTEQPYYDRQISFGDSNWKDYELYAEVQINNRLTDLDGRRPGGPPYLSHSHVSFNLRWGGHPAGDYQPRRDWMNLGSLVALRCDRANKNRGMYPWLHFGRGIKGLQSTRSMMDRDRRIMITDGETYAYRMRVKTLASTEAEYWFRVWKIDQAEPTTWMIRGVDAAEANPSGGVVFVVHHADATLKRVSVEPI